MDGEITMAGRFRSADGLIVAVKRKDRGRALRSAMHQRGVSIKELAALTEAIDGKGVNWRTIGFLVSEWKSGRESTTYRNAALICKALDVPIDLVFDVTTTRSFDMLGVSTNRGSGVERRTA